MGFVFYDTETTGLNAAFDQIVHIAAIRTDDNLRPVERLDAKSRLMPHILPSPEALCVTGLGIAELRSTARPSFLEMMCKVRTTLLGWSPSTFIGYNSIRFDEAFLRHGFYQTLHPAYLTSRHGNARGEARRHGSASPTNITSTRPPRRSTIGGPSAVPATGRANRGTTS